MHVAGSLVHQNFQLKEHHGIHSTKTTKIFYSLIYRGNFFKCTDSGGYSCVKESVSSTIKTCSVSESSIGRAQID